MEILRGSAKPDQEDMMRSDVASEQCGNGDLTDPPCFVVIDALFFFDY